MRSQIGLAASVAGLLTYPAAMLAGAAIGDRAVDTAVHIVLGSAFVLLAAAMFDFRLARWVTLIGATAAATFGGIFLLQAGADVTDIAALDWLAFEVLGQQLERVLPDVVYVWFAALLLTGSAGWSRFIGWAIVPVLFGLEAAIVIGAQIGVEVPFLLPVIFLPFVWLLVESVRSATSSQPAPVRQGVELTTSRI